jgi:TolB-like protein/Tfp pilus assembly protein PilF/predicted Ser/Thr protein kinase
MSAFASGSVVARYRIVSRLGAGGLGEVYEAFDPTQERIVALKVLHSDLIPARGRVQRFLREAKAASALHHPSIATVYDVGSAEVAGGEVVYVAMERVRGRTLREAMSGPDRLSLDRALAAMCEVAEALAKTHAAGIVHRDLKPDNVMVTDDGHAKLLDFGLATLLDREGRAGEPFPREQRMLGTPGYLAPEQIEGVATDHRVDLFAFGCILSELASGRRAFRGRSTAETLQQIVNADPPPITEVHSAAPRLLAPIVARCLAKRPSDRYASMTDLLADLDRVRERIAPGRLPLTTAERRPARWQASAITAAVLVAAFVVLALLARRDARPLPAVGAAAAASTHNASAADGGGADGAAADGRTPDGSPADGNAMDGTAADADPAPADREVIAVLPFENLGEAADAYFAAGMTEELTDRLASVRRLGVISRTSASQYAKSAKSVRAIGAELGADYILEGSVRWQHDRGVDRVRVTPRLIRVADDTRVWSSQYERGMKDVFKVQSDIAGQVIRELRISIGGDEVRAMQSELTDNVQAYEAYLRGQDFVARSYAENDARNAVKAFERAVTLDPAFAMAQARLAMAHAYLAHVGYDRTPARLEQARAAIDRALARDPDLPLAHVALGYYWYWGHRDYERASAEFALAWKGMPNNAEILEAIGFVRRRKGDFDQALEDLTNAQRLDPQNRRLLLDLGQTYLSLRRFGEAAATYDHAIALAPNDPLGYAGRAETEWMKGSLATAQPFAARLASSDEEAAVAMRFRQALYARDAAAALRVLKTTSVRTFLLLHVEQSYVPKELLLADAQTLKGNHAAARQAFAAARHRIEAELVRTPDDARLHSVHGLALAGLGEKEAAIAAGRKAVELLPVATDALSGPERLLDLAKIYAAVGEREQAIAELQRLLSIPSLVAPGILRLDPAWDTLRDREEFKRLARP